MNYCINQDYWAQREGDLIEHFAFQFGSNEEVFVRRETCRAQSSVLKVSKIPPEGSHGLTLFLLVLLGVIHKLRNRG